VISSWLPIIYILFTYSKDTTFLNIGYNQMADILKLTVITRFGRMGLMVKGEGVKGFEDIVNCKYLKTTIRKAKSLQFDLYNILGVRP
jgi:hypothetical protein